jgi:hypothetical protein
MRSVVIAVDGPDCFFFAAAVGGPENSAQSAMWKNEIVA